MSEGAQTARPKRPAVWRWPEATIRTSLPSTAAANAARAACRHLPAVGRVAGQWLVDEDEDRRARVGHGMEPVVVLGVAEQVGVGTDESPAREVEDEAIVAPGLRGTSSTRRRPVGLVAVLADVVVAGDARQADRDVVEEPAGEGSIVLVVGVLEHDVAAVHDEVGWILPQPIERGRPVLRDTGTGREVGVGELDDPRHGMPVTLAMVRTVAFADRAAGRAPARLDRATTACRPAWRRRVVQRAWEAAASSARSGQTRGALGGSERSARTA